MVRAVRERITVEAPATSANLGSGYDVFGLALERPRDRVSLSLEDGPGVTVEVSGPSAERIPADPERNTAGLTALIMREKFGLEGGIRLKVEKGIPMGVGLGGSAASAAATAVALDRAFDLHLDVNELCGLAARGEVAAAGSPHADNASAAVAGGVVVVLYDPHRVVRLRPPASLGLVVVTPAVPSPEKKTEALRAILPKEVPMGSLVHNVGHASTLIAGLLTEDYVLIGLGVRDAVVEPVRTKLVPGYESAKKRALEAGASAVYLSGAGPTIIGIVDRRRIDWEEVMKGAVGGFDEAGVASSGFCALPGDGAKVVEEG